MKKTVISTTLIILVALSILPVLPVKASDLPLRLVPVLSTGVVGPGDTVRVSVTVQNPNPHEVQINGYDVSLSFNINGQNLAAIAFTSEGEGGHILHQGTIYDRADGSLTNHFHVMASCESLSGKCRSAGVLAAENATIAAGGSDVLYHVEFQVLSPPASETDSVEVPCTVSPDETVMGPALVVVGSQEYAVECGSTGVTFPPAVGAAFGKGANPRAVPKHLDISRGITTTTLRATVIVSPHAKLALVRVTYSIVSGSTGNTFTAMAEMRLDPSTAAMEIILEAQFTVEDVPAAYKATATLSAGSIAIDPTTGEEKAVLLSTDSKTLNFRASL